MTAAERWERLAAAVEAAGIAGLRIDSRNYSESEYGRVRFGTSYGARLILPDGRHISIGDRWWRKNPDVWIGYAVEVEDSDGIIRRAFPVTKKRSEVVAAVVEAVAP